MTFIPTGCSYAFSVPTSPATLATLATDLRSRQGVQYSELIDKVRFDRAVYLLRHSNRSMKNIAGQLSYSEPGAFIRAFSRWAGRTPTEFRQADMAR